MRRLAPDVYQLRGFAPHAINAYLIAGVLVDAGTPLARRRILRQLKGHEVDTHVVTHGHPDHFGSSHAVCEALDVPLWTGERDAQAIESARPEIGQGRIPRLMSRMKMPPAHQVARRLHEGDEVAGFSVLDVPGHSPGHIALWRESDGVLLCGDVFFNVRGTTAPPAMLTVDPDLNRESMRRLAALRPALVLFGHGRPLRDPNRLARAAR